MEPLELVELPGKTKGLVLLMQDEKFKILRPLDQESWIVDGPFPKTEPVKPLRGGVGARRVLQEQIQAGLIWPRGLQKHTLRMGTDPEICAVDETSKFLPSHEWIAEKAEPKKDIVYRDGLLAEFYTEPSSCLSFLGDAVQAGLSKTHLQLKRLHPKAELTLQNIFEFSSEEMAEFPNETVQLGCAPSLNAYGETQQFPEGREVLFRTAGGHIHLGMSEQATPPLALVKLLDKYLGVASVVLAAGMDRPLRRQLYGRAGEFRLPKWGLEYRVLSNFWLCHPGVMQLVFELARAVYGLYQTGLGELYLGTILEQEEIRRIINETDVAAAKKHVTANLWLYESLFRIAFMGGRNAGVTETDRENSRALALRIIQVGIQKFGIPMNLVENWRIETKDWVMHSELDHASWGTIGRTLNNAI